MNKSKMKLKKGDIVYFGSFVLSTCNINIILRTSDDREGYDIIVYTPSEFAIRLGRCFEYAEGSLSMREGIIHSSTGHWRR